MGGLDVIEMVADWGAAVLRHDDGDLGTSIVKNAERFGYDDDFQHYLSLIAHEMELL